MASICAHLTEHRTAAEAVALAQQIEVPDAAARKKAAAEKVRRDHLHKCGRLGARDGRGLPIHWAGHYLAVAGHCEQEIRAVCLDVFGDDANVRRHLETTVKALRKKGLLP